jgi:hypothetical protein
MHRTHVPSSMQMAKLQARPAVEAAVRQAEAALAKLG